MKNLSQNTARLRISVRHRCKSRAGLLTAAISLSVALTAVCGGSAAFARSPSKAPVVDAWVTSGDGHQRLSRLDPIEMGQGPAEALVIRVDPSRRYQAIEGFGASFTDSSVWLLRNRLDARQRSALLRDLFDPKTGLGLGLTRITIGASDFSQTHYSYDDMPPGETDPGLTRFSIAPARANVLPVVREAMSINRALRVFASPWSAPGWMKTSGSMIKGKLSPEYYDAFAHYLDRTIAALAAEHVPVYALSIQNEPNFQPENYPGMHMDASERAAFVGGHLGPLLARSRSRVRLLDWDHNWDQPQSPLAVLADPVARKYIAGTAWHCYAGNVSAQSQVHDAYPEKETWFTECAGGAWMPEWRAPLVWMTRNLIIGSTRNWAKGVILWNIALDENDGPHLGGCGNCRGVVTINQKTGAVTRNVEYYVLGHASRFVRPGARRIESDSGVDGLETVAFQNPGNGKTVLIVLNTADQPRHFSAGVGNDRFSTSLAAGSVATFTWPTTLTRGRRREY